MAKRRRLTTTKTVPEKVIEEDIFKFLRLNGIFCWKNPTTGYFDVKIKRWRKHVSANAINGAPDILGIYDERPLAIEVKSAKGKLTSDQEEFLERFNKEGGIAFVARSVRDVMMNLDSVNKQSELDYKSDE